MFNNDPEQQKQQNPYPLYTAYGPAPAGQPGQAAPVTDKVPAAPAPAWQQPVPQPGTITPAWQQPMPQPGATAPAWQQPAPMPHQAGTTAPAWQQQPSVLQPGQPIPPQRPRRSRTRSGAIFALSCLLAIVFGVGIFSGWSFARSSGGAAAPTNTTSPSSGGNGNLGAFQTAQEMAIAKVEPAVVQIQGTLSQSTSLGSGVIIDNKGDIVTNNHVVNGASSLTVMLKNGSQQTAQVIGTDSANDLAVIRIQPFANMAVATLGDSSQLTVGQEVLAIGNPLGYSGSATSGVVSALNRVAQEPHGAKLTGMIQTSAAINPGNSGGALINLQGQVVGIPTLSAVNNETNTPANGIGFAIPSNQVQAVITRIAGK